MSLITYDQIVEGVRTWPPDALELFRAGLQLAAEEQQQLLEELPQSPPIQHPEVKVRKVVARDFSRETKWIRENAHLYPGEHLAISGDQLLAHGKDLGAVYDEAKATGQKFLTHHEPPIEGRSDWHGMQHPEVKVRKVVARDFTREVQWIRENAHLYPGEHLAISGDQLLAHGKDLGAVYEAANATGQKFLTHYQPPAGEIWGGGMWL